MRTWKLIILVTYLLTKSPKVCFSVAEFNYHHVSKYVYCHEVYLLQAQFDHFIEISM